MFVERERERERKREMGVLLPRLSILGVSKPVSQRLKRLYLDKNLWVFKHPVHSLFSTSRKISPEYHSKIAKYRSLKIVLF